MNKRHKAVNRNTGLEAKNIEPLSVTPTLGSHEIVWGVVSSQEKNRNVVL